MKKSKSIKFKITTSTMACFFAGMLILILTLLIYLQSALSKIAEDTLKSYGEKYANLISGQFDNPISFLSGICSMVEEQMATGNTNRISLQKLIFNAFEKYTISEGTAFMLEPNVYDGLDSQYIGTDYGTKINGRISYYYYRENGMTMYLPQTEDNEQEFVQPYYVDAKNAKKPVLSEPYLYSFGGNTVYMITASNPLVNRQGNVLGVATVDLYLKSIHDALAKEKIYKTGYMVVTTKDGLILYSPNLDDVGKNARDVNLPIEPLSTGEDIKYSKMTSIVNGLPSVAVTLPVDLNLSESRFYITVVAPESEVNAISTTLIFIVIIIAVVISAVIIFVINLIANGIEIDLNKIIGKLTASSERISDSVNKLNESSENLANGSTKQAASIEETSATMNEEASMVIKTAENTKIAAQLAADATNMANKGVGEMKNMIQAMDEIKESSDKVGKIVKTIDDIAFQTNILALNAAVEAARAGDAGKGFAVVAEEVRNLAGRSAEAAASTSDIIEKNIELTNSGREVSNEVSTSLEGITEKTNKLNELISEISVSSEEQASGIKQINIAVSQMGTVTQENAMVAQGNLDSSNIMKDEILNLEDAINIAKSLISSNTKK